MLSDIPIVITEVRIIHNNHMLDKIIGQYQPGMKIPSERVLAEHLGIARMTLRHDIAALILDGKLERRPGSGTYIANQCYSLSAQCRSFSTEMQLRGLVPRNEIISRNIISADKVLSSKLRIPRNSKVLKFSRIRYGGETPMAVQYCHIPTAYIGKVESSELEGSLEDLLLHKFSIGIANSQTEIAGGFPDLKISHSLSISRTTPCLIKETTDIDQRSRTVMWNKTWYNAEKFRIRFDAACKVPEEKTVTAS